MQPQRQPAYGTPIGPKLEASVAPKGISAIREWKPHSVPDDKGIGQQSSVAPRTPRKCANVGRAEITESSALEKRKDDLPRHKRRHDRFGRTNERDDGGLLEKAEGAYRSAQARVPICSRNRLGMLDGAQDERTNVAT